MRSIIRQKLESGRTVLGMINFIGAPMVVEIMASAGIDFAIIDMEHSAVDLDRLAHVVRAADAAGISAFVRIPELDPSLLKVVLNLGVEGIVLPHATAERCRRLADVARYAPEGSRGACPVVRATGYWPADWSAYADRANREVMLMPLVEDREALDEFDELAATPGISAIFVGPYDLSVSLGVPGAAFDHPKMSAALDRVIAAAARHGKYVFTTVGDRQDRDYSAALVGRGVQGLIFATDGLVFLQACKRLVANVRSETAPE